jgi:hypothetical protein
MIERPIVGQNVPYMTLLALQSRQKRHQFAIAGLAHTVMLDQRPKWFEQNARRSE